MLDEPTSALDPAAAEEALAAVRRLVLDNGITVLAAEHRLERVVEYADSVVLMDAHRVQYGEPKAMMRESPLAPPVVELARLVGWEPLPLSVRDARRLAAPLRARIDETSPTAPLRRTSAAGAVDGAGLEATGVVVRYGSRAVVREVDLTAAPGEVVALMGRNGSGKSSLLWAVQGSGPMASGRVEVGGRSTRDVSRARPLRWSRSSRSRPPTCSTTRTSAPSAAPLTLAGGVADGTTWSSFVRLGGGRRPGAPAHPRDLSDGQRLALALAVQLASDPGVVLLDEPTRGFDYTAKRRLVTVLRSCADDGKAVVVATHDVEFVAELADRVVVLGEGTVVTDAPAAEALAASTMFAPQVAKVLAPLPLLTVDDVARAIAPDSTQVLAHGRAPPARRATKPWRSDVGRHWCWRWRRWPEW